MLLPSLPNETLSAMGFAPTCAVMGHTDGHRHIEAVVAQLAEDTATTAWKHVAGCLLDNARVQQRQVRGKRMELAICHSAAAAAMDRADPRAAAAALNMCDAVLASLASLVAGLLQALQQVAAAAGGCMPFGSR